ncbi:MAG: ATP-dependent RNA helicase RhlE, partial [Planctomycetota bacterium]
MSGRDVLGLAQTGTGKTAAFALPILEQLSKRGFKYPRALILAPTRELAIQTHAEIGVLAKYTQLRAVTVFGGVGAGPQVRSLRARPDIIVACPGRLLDLLSSSDVNLSAIEILVLDEADHMLDMGFLPDIKRILKFLPQERQNLLFSATMPNEIRSLTDRVLHDPHVVELAIRAPAETIDHALYPVEQARKTALLKHLLEGEDFRSAIVFLRTKHRAKRLARDLDKAGHRAIALQGNMSQGQRTRAMEGFREGKFDVLVATDIAARGIDVANVSHVINFDIPGTPDAYTHRIGRTGRAEKKGKACTFVTHEDFPSIKAIERKLQMQIPRIKLRDFWVEGEGEDSAEALEQGGGWSRGRPISRGGPSRRGGGGGFARRSRGGGGGRGASRGARSTGGGGRGRPGSSSSFGSSAGVSFSRSGGGGSSSNAPAAPKSDFGAGVEGGQRRTSASKSRSKGSKRKDRMGGGPRR